MIELVDRMLRKHMMELLNILDGKSAPPQPPSRLSSIAIWPFVMKELIDKTSPYGITPPPTSPESEHWESELLDLPPPSLPPPPPPLPAVRPTTLPTRIRHRNRRLRFSPYDASIHIINKKLTFAKTPRSTPHT